MLENVSWEAYWLAVAIVTAIYEILVVLIFFRKELSRFPSKVGKEKSNFTPSREGKNTNSLPALLPSSVSEADQKENEVLLPQAHELFQSLQEYIQDVAQRSFIKEEVIMGLQVILRDYKKLMGTPFQNSISDFIFQECDDKCSIHLSAEELNSVWIG